MIKNIYKAYMVWRQGGMHLLRQRIIKLLSPDRWNDYQYEASLFAPWLDFSPEHLEASQKLNAIYTGELDIHSITWFLPEFSHPYYGGIKTALSFANFLNSKGIENRFAILGRTPKEEIVKRITQVYPALAKQPVTIFQLRENIASLEATDAAIATLWGTAYFLLQFNQTKRKFYFLQDYEPLFYPAGSIYGQIQETYRFGFYGIANTITIKEIYESYGGQSEYFLPCVDTQLFHPPQESQTSPSSPLTVFFYGRPNHPRNGFELGAHALRLLKKRLGSQLRVVAAGDNWSPKDYGLKGVVENLGRLDYHETAELYRSCQVGLVLMFTRHPSYLPFELMASGSLVVTNYNPATTWLLKDNQNCILSRASATCLAQTLEKALLDQAARRRITANAASQINASYSDWDAQFEKIYRYMRDPHGGE